jgi:hypothetical protein
MWIIRGLLLLILALGCFALSPTGRAVDPTPDGSYPNQNTAEGEDALLSLTTGTDNTAMAFDALHSNTPGSDNALSSRTLRTTGRLNTARWQHTATLLQNGMVLVAGGIDSNFIFFGERRTVRPSERDVDCHGQSQRRTR